MSGQQFVPFGPRIPFEVLAALLEERLVFFCGSGISIPTFSNVKVAESEKSLSLDFKGLTTFAFNACNSPIDKSGKPKEPAAADAYSRELYDKALEILARISHCRGCIGPKNLRKSFWQSGLPDSAAGSDANTVYLRSA